jgi:hypothetical protein
VVSQLDTNYCNTWCRVEMEVLSSSPPTSRRVDAGLLDFSARSCRGQAREHADRDGCRSENYRPRSEQGLSYRWFQEIDGLDGFDTSDESTVAFECIDSVDSAISELLRRLRGRQEEDASLARFRGDRYFRTNRRFQGSFDLLLCAK